MKLDIVAGDSLEVLRSFEPNSFDSCVTDPPAAISFMGKEWDSDGGDPLGWSDWLSSVFVEVLRVLKPGAHCLVWALPRTSFLTGLALYKAGFEIRDVLTHINGQGWPKGTSIAKQIDKRLGFEPTVVGTREVSRDLDRRGATGDQAISGGGISGTTIDVTEPTSEEAKRFEGCSTQLKPAGEHWILSRKPLERTVIDTLLKYGTGALQIDATRLPPSGGTNRREGERTAHKRYTDAGATNFSATPGPRGGSEKGRYPPNVLLSHAIECEVSGSCVPWCSVLELDRQSGRSGGSAPASGPTFEGSDTQYDGGFKGKRNDVSFHGRASGASEFFPTFRYQAKASPAERDDGLEGEGKETGFPMRSNSRESSSTGEDGSPTFRRTKRVNTHPTVKPVSLMRWLVRLVTPAKGTVLDPFTGSGSTAVACAFESVNFQGIELSPEYADLARRRVAAASRQGVLF